MNGISKERKEKENVDSIWYTGVRNEFRVRCLNHPHFSSEILVYLRGNKPCSDHLLFNRRAGFRSDGKKSRDAGKAGRGGEGEARGRERTWFGRETRLNVFIRWCVEDLERVEGGWTEPPEHELPPAGNGPITCPPFLRTWPVILRSTFTNDPAYRSGSLRGR